MELPGRNSRRTGTENSMRICDQNIQPDGYGIRDRCSSGGSGSRSLPHFRKPQQQRRREKHLELRRDLRCTYRIQLRNERMDQDS